MPHPLRLALAITELGVGGAEKCLVDLATRVDRSQFEPVVYSLKARPAFGSNPLIRRLEEADVPIQFLNLRRTTQFFSAVRHLANLLEEQRVDVLQTFLYHANVVGAWAAQRAKVGCFIAGIRVAQPKPVRGLVERWNLRTAYRIVCVSESVAGFFRQRAAALAERAVVIPNGIDLAEMDRLASLPLPDRSMPLGRRTIVAAGRLDPQKGFDLLLQAAAKFLTFLPEHDLVIVGEGPQRHRLTKLAAHPSLAGRVHLIGFQANLPAILRAAELFVLSSRYEGMPNVLLEAMAVGKPIVATRVEGVMEVLGPLAAEQTVDRGDVIALAGRIGALIGDLTLARQIGEKNRARVAAEFSLASMVERYQTLWQVTASTLG